MGSELYDLGISGESLHRRVEYIKSYILKLKGDIEEIQKNTQEKTTVPYTKSGGNKDTSHSNPTDISTGMINNLSGAIIWNDAELKFTPYGTKPTTAPVKGYNRHSHSRFSGGALDIKTLEIVEYDIDWVSGDFNKDCQSLWQGFPSIKKEQNSNKKNVNKIGNIDFIFNADTGKWGTSAYEIDVKKCYLVKRDVKGVIEKDVNDVEMKAPLYNDDVTKTNIIWDKSAKCWRIYAVYAEDPEVPTP
jgi:hypothetical protein